MLIKKMRLVFFIAENNENHDKDPQVGMEFDSPENAYSLYKIYAKKMGFGVTTRSSCRSKLSGQFIDVKYVCTRHGTKRETNVVNPRPCLKMECKAMFHIKRKHDGMWFLHNFIKDHNHDLFPAHSHFFPCHRSFNSAKRYDINTLHAIGVKTTKIFAAMAKQHGGYENIGCLEKDIRNHLDKERRLAIESGDANAMLEFFMHMQEKDSNFFYAMDLDDEHRLKNVFWVDGKGREDYQNFGAVVSFDTTYIRNKYQMPFAPYIGVNNHHQSTLLGCALLANESTSTFSWLMQTWVRAMGGKPPRAIITDQDRAMKATIQLVFPDSRHRHCLWHILKKVPEKLGHVIRTNEDFMGFFNKCIYKFWTKDQFEKKWQALVEKFDLMEDEWLQSLYEDREHWVRTYMKDTFFVGMSTTQRMGCINGGDFLLMSLNGFLCRHSLCTLHSLGVFNIPSRYILKWWTKDVRTKYKKGSGCEELQSKKQRRDDLFDRATELIEEGSLSLESYNIAHQALQDALKRCSSVNHSLNLSNKDACGANESHDLGKENFDCNILHEKKILDPKVSKTKGAPKRIKHGIEEKHKGKSKKKSTRKDTQSKAGKSKNNFSKDYSSNSGTQDASSSFCRGFLCFKVSGPSALIFTGLRTLSGQIVHMQHFLQSRGSQRGLASEEFGKETPPGSCHCADTLCASGQSYTLRLYGLRMWR
ncbi:hypothetical protein COLO4_24061 [Corchorus olitorius]|uniref:Protein FAR1-RELATED SEQUENCE n=1 Tax=Corchorus olitorius TaxID=93759 RepID=A0A1R3ID62_9ROSI|nr:hypothetical protein COLO4_24061 [Corchorus olitorius]